jgi:hypothetical protein
MAKNSPEGMPQVIPYLYCADVPKAVDWLVEAFGFEKIMVHSSGAGRHHGEVRFGDGPMSTPIARARRRPARRSCTTFPIRVTAAPIGRATRTVTTGFSPVRPVERDALTGC